MKSSLILFAVLLAVIAFIACNRKSGTNTQQVTPDAKDVTDKAEPAPDAAGEAPDEAYQVAGFQKTACFGKCPVYMVKFFSDGKVTWYGKMNVDRMGWHEARVDKEVLKRIKDKANEVNFFDFYGEYPTGTKVADLPSTITYIRIGDMEKQVKNTHEAPEKLKEFEQFMSDLIESLAWRASEK